MQRECELVEQEWDGMIPALKDSKFDAIVASMSITEERKRQIDFSTKYYQTPARLVARKDAGVEGTSEGLAGKRSACSGVLHINAMPRKPSPMPRSCSTARKRRCSGIWFWVASTHSFQTA